MAACEQKTTTETKISRHRTTRFFTPLRYRCAAIKKHVSPIIAAIASRLKILQLILKI